MWSIAFNISSLLAVGVGVVCRLWFKDLLATTSEACYLLVTFYRPSIGVVIMLTSALFLGVMDSQNYSMLCPHFKLLYNSAGVRSSSCEAGVGWLPIGSNSSCYCY